MPPLDRRTVVAAARRVVTRTRSWMMKTLLPGTQRRMAAILIADVVGYSRLMEANEDLTHAWMMRLRSETLEPGIEEFGGRTVKNTGDGFVAVFDTARDAITCARGLQQALTAQTA